MRSTPSARNVTVVLPGMGYKAGRLFGILPIAVRAFWCQ